VKLFTCGIERVKANRGAEKLLPCKDGTQPMKRLIECVPNFSEGRDLAKVSSIVEAMRSVPGVYVLDQEMDADHNRCVITLAGDPDAVGRRRCWAQAARWN